MAGGKIEQEWLTRNGLGVGSNVSGQGNIGPVFINKTTGEFHHGNSQSQATTNTGTEFKMVLNRAMRIFSLAMRMTLQ